MGSIADNTGRIIEKVADACRDAGRDPSEVKILAAAKYTDRAGAAEILSAGIGIIGENRIQDALAKHCADEESGQVDIHEEFPGVNVHYIGHLQKNKINHALKLFDLIETIDTIKLAEALDKRLTERDRVMPVLLEVKLTSEDTKTGCSESDLEDLIGYIGENCPHLEVRGLMGMGPWDPDPETARPFYKKLRENFERIKNSTRSDKFDTVSMGMSADFHIAIQEGATLVRIGRALFI